MRKFWGILLFILVCNATSLVARVAAIDPSTRALVTCYIDEQSEEDMLDNRPESYGLHRSETSSTGLASHNFDRHSSKSQLSTNSRFGLSATSDWSGHINYTIHHRQCEMHNFSLAKDLYIYALRHIVI